MITLAKVSPSPGGGNLIAIIDNDDISNNRIEYQYLSKQLSLFYREVSSSMDPYTIIKELHLRRVPQLVVITNDSPRPSGLPVEWVRAIGATQQPCILLLSETDHSSIGDQAAAYQALLEQYKVPLVGMLQMGGIWNPIERRQDGLAWCGWWQGLTTTTKSKEISELEISSTIRRRWSYMLNDKFMET